MRFQGLAVSLGVLAFGASALAACSGMQSAGVPIAPPQAPAQQAVLQTQSAEHQVQNGAQHASPQSTPANPYPFTQGDTFNYTYNAAHSVKQPGKGLVKSSTTGTIVTTIGATTTFNGHQATDVNNVLSYTNYNNGNQVTATGTTTTDDYEAFVPTNGLLDYDLYGSTLSGSESDTNGLTRTSSQTLTYSSPFLLDRLPETKGDVWHVVPGSKYTLQSQVATTNGGVTTTETSTYARGANGSYALSLSNTNGYQDTAYQSSKGSAQDQNNGTGKNAGTTTFSAPARQNGKYVIVVVYTPPKGPQTKTDVPDWFPGNGPVDNMATDASTDLGTVKVPTKCGSTAGQQGQELREELSFIDAVKGTYNAETIDRYVVFGMGLVCVDHQRLLNTYDNRSTGALLASETFNGTQALTSETIGDLRTHGTIAGFSAR